MNAELGRRGDGLVARAVGVLVAVVLVVVGGAGSAGVAAAEWRAPSPGAAVALSSDDPGLVDIADGVNAIWYAAEGDYTNAALSAAAMIPGLGAGATALKYTRKGLDAVGTLRKAGNTGDELVDLYRAVDANELADIAKNGFRVGPGLEAKQFGLKLDEVLDYATDPGTSGTYQAIVKARVPRSALPGSDFSRSIDPWHFKSGVITVPEVGLPTLNRAIQGGVRIAYQ